MPLDDTDADSAGYYCHGSSGMQSPGVDAIVLEQNGRSIKGGIRLWWRLAPQRVVARRLACYMMTTAF